MSTATTHRLTLPCRPPTLNSLMRGKLRDRMRLGALWKAVVAVYADGIPEAAGKRRVMIRIILGPGQRGADPDAYFKAVGDALVSRRLLRDDSRHWVEWAPVQYERGEREGSVIELEDLP